ncbi:hypothetical protein [Metallosphaera yellowstonensis]|uniref:hypothetical protein n=1 Tax=Metallosphaera yellowstonensis TaxID=1111107 RepID=UPI0012DC6D4D|nr:hypothetical protein [Metallosphaera yellowstonensis]
MTYSVYLVLWVDLEGRKVVLTLMVREGAEDLKGWNVTGPRGEGALTGPSPSRTTSGAFTGPSPSTYRHHGTGSAPPGEGPVQGLQGWPNGHQGAHEGPQVLQGRGVGRWEISERCPGGQATGSTSRRD